MEPAEWQKLLFDELTLIYGDYQEHIGECIEGWQDDMLIH